MADFQKSLQQKDTEPESLRAKVKQQILFMISYNVTGLIYPSWYIDCVCGNDKSLQTF